MLYNINNYIKSHFELIIISFFFLNIFNCFHFKLTCCYSIKNIKS